jgi:plastocyanin
MSVYVDMKVRTRLLGLVLGLAGAACLAAPAATAADRAVVAQPSNVFTPRLVAVRPGEKVTFTNAGGEHDVTWNDGRVPPTPSQPADPGGWPPVVSRGFTRPGRYRFYCSNHGDRNADFGMYGYVYVNAAGVLPPTVSAVHASGSSAGARLTFRASRAGQATATVFRRSGRSFVRFGAASFAARAGANSRLLARAGRRLTSGSYRVDLVVANPPGVRSDSHSARFAIP